MHRSAALASLLFIATAACGPEDDGGGDGAQCETNLLPGDLVLTEVMANPAGDDAGGEYIEIYNTASEALDLTGLTVRYSREDLTDEATHVLPEVVIEPGQYLVLGGILPDFKPDYVDHGYGNAIELRNGGARLALECGEVEVDVLIYPAMDEQGVAYGLDGGISPDHLANDNPVNICPHTMEFRPGTEIIGSPGEPNEDCEVVVPGKCEEGGEMRDVVTPAPGDLVLTEFMANPEAVSDSDGEWIEITAAAGLEGSVDLNDLVLGRSTNSGEDTTTIASPRCISLAAGEHALLAKSADAAKNGGLPPVDATFSFSLVNSDGDVFLRADETELDAITWTSVSGGASRALDPDMIDPTANDDEANWSDCDAAYGDGDPPDTGTPKADNAGCDLSGMCTDGGTPRPINRPLAEDVTISEYMPDPAIPEGDGEWFEVHFAAEADLNDLAWADATGNPDELIQTQCETVPADSYIVFARNTNMNENGGVAADYGYSFALNNTGTETISVSVAGTPLDEVTYDGGDVTEGIARQVDENGDTCDSPNEYDATNAQFGTPGAENPICQ